MKVLFLYIAVIFFINCKQTMKNDIFLEGNWQIIVHNERKCNVCPKVTFKKNGHGKITKPSQEEISFTYILLPDKKIEFSFQGTQSYFSEKEYFYRIYTENNLEMFDLSSMDGKDEYTLSREK